MSKIFRKSFSLIELLVVISCIMILLSMLQPSLLKFKKMAMQTACQNNLNQIQNGFIIYAEDNHGFLPDSPLSGQFNDMNSFYYRNRLDWRPMAREYGFMQSTGNPVTGAATWDDVRNTATEWKRDSRQYFPKNNLNNYISGVRSPTQLSLATPSQSMFTDLLRASPQGEYYGIHGHGGSLLSVGNSPSMSVYWDMLPEGSHISFMDGSTRWAEFSEMKFYNRGTWKHAYFPKSP
jgi:type II secretory pathway pseudopilin PulG